MMFILVFIVGLFLGACVGLLVAGLCVAARQGDAHLATVEQEESPDAPPAL